MAEGVAGVAPGGDGGADEEGFLSEGVVPVVTEVAGLQDEGEDARCFSAPLPVGGIQGQGFDRHSKIIDQKGGKGHPFTHQAHFCQSPFQQLHTHFWAIGPQEPAQITYLPEADAPSHSSPPNKYPRTHARIIPRELVS